MSTRTTYRIGGKGVRHPLWWMGWRPRPTIAGVNLAGFALGNGVMIPASYITGGNGLATITVLTLLGFVGGLLCWRLGVREVNQRADHVLSSFRDRIAPVDGETYDLLAGTGSKLLIRLAKEYTLSRVTVGESSLTIDSGTLDTVERRVRDEQTVELPFDHVDTVSAQEDALVIETDSGTHRLPADEREDAASASTVADAIASAK